MTQPSFPITTHLAGLAAFSCILGTVGCSQRPAAQPEAVITDPAEVRPQVVVTTSILCDLTEQIAAATIDLTCLMDPGQDPHTYQARPSDRQAIDEADLVLYDGYGFAPALIGMIDASPNAAPKVAVYEAAVPNPLMGGGHDHDHGAEADHDHGEADHDHGEADHDHAGADHDHGEADHDHAGADQHDAGEAEVPDPHIWHDADNNAAIATVIATHLSELTPEQAETYQDKAAQLSAQFAAIDGWIQTQVDTIPADNRKMVTTHDSFRYYAEAYGIAVAGALSGLSTDEKPAAGELTALVDQVKAAKVPAIFAETTTNLALIETVANDAGVAVAAQPLFVEGPGGDGTPAATTQAMLVTNTCTIVNALGGTCDAASAPL